MKSKKKLKFINQIEKFAAIPKRIAFNKVFDRLFRIKSQMLDVDLDELQLKLEKNSPILIDFHEMSIDENYVESILNYEIDLLGSGKVSFKSDNDNVYSYFGLNLTKENTKSESVSESIIDWQRDFRSGYRWDDKLNHNEIKIAPIYGAEIKLPWELGRMQFLSVLSLYYLKNSKVEIPKFFQSVVEDFYSSNPRGYGVQWKSPMDVGIRAVNILNSYNILFAAGCEFDTEFDSLIEKLINEHFKWIIEHPEWSSGMRGNHYFATLSSALIILYFSISNDETNNLTTRLLDKFVTEVKYQFNPDGSNFEASTTYHLQVFEMLWCVVYLYPEVKSRIDNFKQILDFTSEISNHSLQIGDNDSGVFLPLAPTLKIHNKYSYVKNDYANLLEYLNYKSSLLRDYRDIGLYFFGDNRLSGSLRCGEVGQKGKGGHSHCDQLSIALNSNGNQILVDPGTFNYTSLPNERNTFRATNMHNTVQIENDEQHKFIANDDYNELFWMISNSKFEVKAEDSKIDAKLFTKKGLIHRKLFVSDSEIEIVDSVDSEKEAKAFFHFYPNIKLIFENKKLILQDYSLIFELESDNFEIQDYYYSEEYGIKEKAKKLVVFFQNNHKTIIKVS